MKLVKSFVLICLLSAAAFSASAQKIGYVNSQGLLSLMPEVKEANSNLETYSAQLSKRAEQMYQSLQTKAAALQQKRDSGEISPKQLEIELATLQQEEQKLFFVVNLINVLPTALMLLGMYFSNDELFVIVIAIVWAIIQFIVGLLLSPFIEGESYSS